MHILDESCTELYSTYHFNAAFVFCSCCCNGILDCDICTCSSYNPLLRVAGKIQYDAEAKQRPSNCILPEA